ncbi:polysaccharide deacetylase family protein [Rothia sp. AR01]|uniref:Polysaccharide deacetylase family protein n=1 Tax=Rothia santali TaxID=2949643 RepID=A0A9X2KI76_9MICC|nr:polysaccharide deacetylase family protein [Rothia santali]MCP3425574.1 polysaccharide deacetylase family protein [Rothia santali]
MTSRQAGGAASAPGAVVLCFDLDGPSGDALVSGALWDKPGFFCQGAYGPHRAVPRILEILRELGLRATFFTPGWVVRTWPELCVRIREAGHEVSGHGDLHEQFFGRPVEEQRAVLESAQESFASVLGERAAGFRAPSGDYDPATPQLLVEAGYAYSSSLRSGDRPFLRRDVPLVELPAKSMFDDYAYFAYHRAPDFPRGLDRVASYRTTFDTWSLEARAAAAEGLTVSTIWHPKVIGTPGRLIEMERFLTGLLEEGAVRFRTAHDVARECLARESGRSEHAVA